MGRVPKWVVIYTVLIGVIAIVASIPDIDAKGWSEAMRNAAPGFAGLAVFAFARKTPAAYFAVIATRAAIEVGDIIGGIVTEDTTTLILGSVVILFDIAALYVLFPLLSNEEPNYGNKIQAA
jgi:hypothetical protein